MHAYITIGETHTLTFSSDPTAFSNSFSSTSRLFTAELRTAVSCCCNC